MKDFIGDKSVGKEIVDVVFEAAQGAVKATKEFGEDAVVNGAFGTYFKEDKSFLTFDTVYRIFDRVPDFQKAKYASSIAGPPEYQEAVKDWLFKSAGLDINADVIATPGGTGALSSTIKNALNRGETVIHPDIGWGPYKTIAKEMQNPVAYYKLFEDEHFNVESFKETCTQVMKNQGKVLAFINDPCQNPTGYTMRDSEWDEVLTFINELSDQGPFILLLDVAYIDFNKRGDDYKQLFEKLSKMSDNVLSVVAFSVSKTMTAYGMRVGAQVLVSNNEQGRRRFFHACGNTARGVWSTVNNGGMMAFANLALNKENKQAYLQEKNGFVKLLQERAEIMIHEAKDVGLPIYPYHEGFFITIKIDDHVIKNELHLKLKKHNIFFVNVYGGLRVAICSIPKAKITGLAAKIKEVLDTIDPTDDDLESVQDANDNNDVDNDEKNVTP